MELFKKTRLKIGERKLKKEFALIRRPKAAQNMESAKVFCIVADTTSADGLQKTKDLLSFLLNLNKQIYVTGYVDSEQITENLLHYKQFNLFTKADLNWYYKPDRIDIDEFIRKDCDILINLSPVNYLPLKYITWLSKAKLKASRFVNENNPYDLMIETGSNNNTGYLIDQLKIYLNMIKISP